MKRLTLPLVLVVACGLALRWWLAHPMPNVGAAETNAQRQPPAEPAAPAPASAGARDHLRVDFPTLLAQLRDRRFVELNNAEVAEAFLRHASTAEILEAICNSDSPFDVGRTLLAAVDDAQLRALVDQAPAHPASVAAAFAQAAAGALAKRNLEAALAFAKARSTPALAAGAYAGILDELGAEGKLAEASRIHASIPSEIRDLDPVRFAYGNSLFDSDPAGAVEALATIQDQTYRDLALTTLSRRLEAHNPSAAVEAILSTHLPDTAKERHVTRILEAWAEWDAATVLRYLAIDRSLPAGLRTSLQNRLTQSQVGITQ